jgi:Fe-Mn family superoxide dismutase
MRAAPSWHSPAIEAAAHRIRRVERSRGRRLISAWAADDTTTLAGGQLILALDMYEHLYHMDYGAKAGDYVEAFLRAIRWSNADSLDARYGSS